MTNQHEAAIASKAWPFIEAEKILERIGNTTPEKGYVLFETGYGPSGLPHIGTFIEVGRTTMVMNAFKMLAPEIPVRLFAVSDDMDGMRKIPDNVPAKDMLTEHLGKRLTDIPDPFGTHDSFGAHMNNRFCQFLDHYEFEYEFISSTECYQKGTYDAKLLEALKNYQKIMDIMLPTLGTERQQTYSPFMPICKKTGKVLQVPTLECNVEKGSITYRDEDGDLQESLVTGGNCKLQWKPDFGMRWAAFDVDFEMYGKDHMASAQIYSKICRTLGGNPPAQYCYEMFLDENGQKISKSKGNGLSMEDWLRYGTPTSLSYYMYQNPRKAKKLYFDMIPKAVDEYISQLEKYQDQDEVQKFANPVWHVHGGTPPKPQSPISFALLINLASACHAEGEDILWGFIERYAPGANAKNSTHLAEMVKHALHYYQDRVKPYKKYRSANDKESLALKSLQQKLESLSDDSSSEDYQNLVYSIGKEQEFDNLRDWFKALYEILLGQSQGPRFGSFISLYGREETAKLIKDKLAG